MKKYLLLPVMAFVLCLVACSSDSDDALNSDDAPKTENVKNLIVGDWLYETSREYVLYHFSPDGTGLFVVDANTHRYTKTKFVYSVDNETCIITIIPYESERESYLVLPINQNCINLQSLINSRNLTLNRYDGDVESEFSINANGHEYVDLGLSVLWATCNVGAIKAEEIGGYYAWGETEVIGDYDDYLYRHGEYPDDYYDFIGKDISGTKYDVAAVKWKGSWRMPTADEFMELIEKCDWLSEIYHGMMGYRVTGPNGNSIFLPAAGHDEGKGYLGIGRGSYWTSTMHSKAQSIQYDSARSFGFDDIGSQGTTIEENGYYSPYDDWGTFRDIGKSVRPVMNR